MPPPPAAVAAAAAARRCAAVSPARLTALTTIPHTDLPIEGKTVKAITLLSLKRTHDLFVGNHGQKVPLDEEAQKAKIACKVRLGWLARGGSEG